MSSNLGVASLDGWPDFRGLKRDVTGSSNKHTPYEYVVMYNWRPI